MNKGLEILNNHQYYEREKTRTLQNIQLTPYKSSIEFNSYSKTCLVYTIWGNRNYLKWLYLSLKTLKTFTDLDMVNIRIITDEYLSKLCRGIFKDILPDECFIVKPFPLLLKYNISNLPEFQRFENIIIWDVDAFVYDFSNTKYNLFQHLIKNINIDDTKIILGYHGSDFIPIFNLMNRNLNNVDPYWWYKNECDIQDINKIDSYYKKWHNSSFTMFKRRTLKTREYRNLCSSLLSHQHLCDETVYHVYGFINNMEISELTDLDIDIIHKHEFDKWFKDRVSGFYWTHPVLGDVIDLKYIRNFYREVNRL